MKKRVKVDLSWRAWSLIVGFFILIGFVGLSFAYGGNSPSVMGHSFGEIEMPACAVGQTIVKNTTGWECASAGGGIIEPLSSEPLIFEVYNSDTTIYACVEQNLKDLCGDENGCKIVINMQHETDTQDQVRTTSAYLYMEQDSMSNGLNSGRYGWARGEGGADSSWINGKERLDTIYAPWGWSWILNFKHDYCSGQVGHASLADPYSFVFMSHPSVRSKFFVYD